MAGVASLHYPHDELSASGAAVGVVFAVLIWQRASESLECTREI